MQLNIAICDDDIKDAETLAAHLGSVCGELDIEARVDTFLSGENFLEENDSKSYDIAFIDIYLKDMNGITVAGSMYRKKPCRVVFTTVSKEHAVEAYNLNAVHYLLKPLDREMVKEAVTRCLAGIKSERSGVLEIKTGRESALVLIDSIMYIEVSNKKCTVITEKNTRFETYASLSSMHELLDGSVFIRPQQSFVVNMHYIDAFYHDHIIMKDGRRIILSRPNRVEMKKQYQDFLFRLARGNQPS